MIDSPRDTWAATAARGTTLALIAWIGSAALFNFLAFFLDELVGDDLDLFVLSLKLINLIPLLFGILEVIGIWKGTSELPCQEPRWIPRLRMTVRTLWVTSYLFYLAGFAARFLLESGQSAVFGRLGTGTWSVFVFLSLFYIHYLFGYLREGTNRIHTRILLVLYPPFVAYQIFVFPRLMLRTGDERSPCDTMICDFVQIILPALPGILINVLLLGLVWRLGRALRRRSQQRGHG
ncbi:MAG: hypothetical protein ACYTBR_16715 [Planctomycetota bacterium]|jgi:hypothetical protein